MATIARYLSELDVQRKALAENLNAMGVEAAASEKLNTLVPKVLQISQSGDATNTKTVLFSSDCRDKIYLQYNSTIYSLDDFTSLYPNFCSSENGYALNYSNTLLGWDISVFTCSLVPISVKTTTQIAMTFCASSTESGILRLVKSDTGTADDILLKAQTEGSYTELPLQWLYANDYITTLTPCDGVPVGEYYLVWVGRSNNTKPLIRNIEII